MANAWLVLAVPDGERTHGGNDGYDDEPSEHYSWDETVHHHTELAVGDVIALWDTKSLLGVSVIERIDRGRAVKSTYACPHCHRARTSPPRATKKPTYRCWNCKAEFDERIEYRKEVTTYRSWHAEAWVGMAGLLTAAELRALCYSPKSQLSLRPLDWERMSERLANGTELTTVRIADSAQRRIAGGHRTATARVRIGQAAFRKRLLEKQGQVCAFTGPAPSEVLEAAHLYSYAAEGEHRPEGGLLLRSDFHRLFDLGLIAVDPNTHTLNVAPKLYPYKDYARLDGAQLAVDLTERNLDWLRIHWDLHRPSR